MISTNHLDPVHYTPDKHLTYCLCIIMYSTLGLPYSMNLALRVLRFFERKIYPFSLAWPRCTWSSRLLDSRAQSHMWKSFKWKLRFGFVPLRDLCQFDLNLYSGSSLHQNNSYRMPWVANSCPFVHPNPQCWDLQRVSLWNKRVTTSWLSQTTLWRFVGGEWLFRWVA